MGIPIDTRAVEDRPVDQYHNNRDTMLSRLQQILAPLSDQIRWNRPSGGFFLSVELPFRFDAEAVTECATDHGVIVMPMAFFALDASQDQRIRLAFSSVDPPRIRTGVTALGHYVVQRINHDGAQSRTPLAGSGS